MSGYKSIKKEWRDFEAFLVTRAGLKMDDVMAGKYDYMDRPLSKRWGDLRAPSFGDLRFSQLPAAARGCAFAFYSEWYWSRSRGETSKYRDGYKVRYGDTGYRR